MVASVKLQMRGGGQAPSDLQGLVAVAPGQPLSARAVRRSIERLFSTGRFSDVVARGDEGPDGLVVTFELAPVVRITRIDVSGAKALGKDEVLAAARLQAGTEFWPEKLDEARTGLLAAYARRGWNECQISATAQPSGDQVVVRLEIHEGTPTRVSALRFEGQPGLSTGRLASAFGLRVGDILDRTRLDPGAEALRTLYRDAGHARARVGAPRVALEGTGAVVTVPVEAGPAFTLRFEGNRRYPSAWLRSALAIDPAETLDRSVLEREARRLEAFYRYRGFRDVRVEPREVVSSDGSRAVVVFHVSEGRQFRVRTVEFEGRAGLSESELRTVLERVVGDRRPEPSDQRLESDPLHLSGRSASRGTSGHPRPGALRGLRRGGLARRRRHHAAGLPRAGLGGTRPCRWWAPRKTSRRARSTSGSTSSRGSAPSSAGYASRACRWGSLRPSCRCSPPVRPSASHGWKRRSPPPSAVSAAGATSSPR